MECPSGSEHKPSLPDTTPPSVHKSLYAEIATFRFADQVLYVHKFLLAKSAKLSAAVSVQGEVDMMDVDMMDVSSAIGHVLVHHLYTGGYDTIASKTSISSAEMLRNSFETYMAAKKYQLGDLCQQARKAIESRSVDLNPSEALAIVKKVYPLPDAGDMWFIGYIMTLLGKTYTDVTAFLSSDLMAFDAAESTMSITEMMLRAVISLTQEKERRQVEEKALQERLKTEMNRDLCAEWEALKSKLIRKGKLGKTDRARFEELTSLMAGDECEPTVDDEEPCLENLFD